MASLKRVMLLVTMGLGDASERWMVVVLFVLNVVFGVMVMLWLSSSERASVMEFLLALDMLVRM